MPFADARAELATLEAHAVYPEGPVWRDGKLYYVEYGGPGVRVWDGSATASFWRSDHCGASGLIATRKDRWLVACYDANTLVELDRLGRVLRTIDRDSAGNAFVGPNDFTADASGGIYFSASGVYDVAAPITGTVLYLPAAGGAPVIVADTIHYPNGLTVSADGRHLLVAEDLAGRILDFPIDPGGTLGLRSVWARLRDLAAPTAHEDAYNGPDGLKLGPDGNYYIAQNGSGRVLVVSERKVLVRTIEVPTPYVTNVNFGDGGSHAVYLTGVFDPWKPPFPGAVYRWAPP